jgi:DNA-binding CsgD family transcriptional regulator
MFGYPTTAPMKQVTMQEKRILEMIAKGLSTREVASVLDISPHTVESHRKNLLLKFRAKNSAELVTLAIQAKAIDINKPDSYNRNPNDENYG